VDPLRPSEDYYECTFDNHVAGEAILGIEIGYKVILLLSGIWVTFSVRKVHLQLYNETKFIAFSLYLVFIALVVLIPIHAATISRQTVFLIRAIILTTTIMGTVLLIFMPKYKLIFTFSEAELQKNSRFQRSSLGTDTTSSATPTQLIVLLEENELLKEKVKSLTIKLSKFEEERAEEEESAEKSPSYSKVELTGPTQNCDITRNEVSEDETLSLNDANSHSEID